MGSSTARTIKQLQGDGGVHVLPPVLSVCRYRDLPVGPLAGEMDAHTGHNGRTVLQAKRGQVQTARQDVSQKSPTTDMRTDSQDSGFQPQHVAGDINAHVLQPIYLLVAIK